MLFRAGWFAALLVSFFIGYQLAPKHLPWAMACFLIPSLAFLAITLRRSQRGAAENNRGISLMSEGRYVEAIDAFQTAHGDMRFNPLPPYNIGLCQLWLWKLDEARDAIDRATKTLSGRPIRIMAVPSLAFIAAMQNDRPRSLLLDQEIEKLGLSRTPMIQLTRAVWLARQARWGEVIQALQMDVTRRLGGPTRSIADALRAWSVQQLGLPALPLDAVGVFGETGPEALKRWWPEFTAFLVK